jgi:lycopene cyclase domain-containing protein
MTYTQFLILFLLIPIGLLAFKLRRPLTRREPRWLALLMLLALSYTAPWDNYLVASGVWAYDPGLVAGLTIGWVPVEEYVFFLLQPLLTGLWAVFMIRRFPKSHRDSRPDGLRTITTLIVTLFWLSAIAALLFGAERLRYLSLILAWALPPIGLQLAFGADILWAERTRAALGLVPATAFLCAADALAIQRGIWTINPESSSRIFLGGALPLEEALFFLLTNALIVSTLVLLQADDSRRRLDRGLNILFSHLNPVQG